MTSCATSINSCRLKYAYRLDVIGFSKASLDWKAWQDMVSLSQARAEQIVIRKMSKVKAKTSDCYLLLTISRIFCKHAQKLSTPSRVCLAA